LFFTSLSVFQLLADGSRNLYPNGVSGNRASLQIRTGGSAGYDPFPTSGTMYVYLKAGETLYVGSSAQGKQSSTIPVYSGTINMWSPNGNSYTSGTSTTVGLIASRAEELAGPRTSANPSGYLPYNHIVTAAEEGVWKVEFTAASNPNAGNITGYGPILANDSWTQPIAISGDADRSLLAAFDISVGSAANAATIIPGRVFCNTLNLNMPFNTPGLYSKVYVLTNVGYVYQISTDNLVGGGFNIFSNSKGIKNGTDPSYLSETYVNGNSYGNTLATILAKISDPRLLDNGTDITHKIFFSKPAADMPETANRYSGSATPDNIWLRKSINTLPQINNLKIKGAESEVEGVFGPDGAYIYFVSNVEGRYKVILQFGGSFTDRTLEGYCVEGDNNVLWDGKDGSGNPVTESTTIQIVGKFTAAEVHFPFCDMEFNGNGVKIELLDPTTPSLDLYSPSKDIVYWDDSKISNTTGPSSPQINNNSGSGVSSNTNGHNYGLATSLNNSFGNESILDTWSYIPSNQMTTSGLTFVIKKIDLAVQSIVSDVTTAQLGNTVTYTIVVNNINNAGAGATEDAIGAKFGFEAPAGFTITGHTFTQTIGTASESNVAGVGTNVLTSDFNLTNGGTVTYTITGTVGSALVHGTLAPRAYVIRPADITDIDATSYVSGTPTDPDVECNGGTSGAGCNNIKVASSVTITNTAPVANDDVASTNEDVTLTVTESNGLIKNSTTGDTDVDGDALTVTGYTISGISGTQTIGSAVNISSVGSLTIHSDGSYSFVPAANYHGSVPEVTYTISDGHGGTASAKLNITVNSINDAPVANDDVASTNEDVTLTVTESNGLIKNSTTGDTDVDGDALTVTGYTISGISGTQTIGSAVNISSVGSLTIHSDGSYSFVPVANYHGSVPEVTYTISDGHGGTASAKLNITVNSINDAPVANDDVVGTALIEDGANGTVNIITNDTDVDGNPTAPINGTGTFSVDIDLFTSGIQNSYTDATGVWTLDSATGIVTYDPANNYNGTATITYELCDPEGLCDQADITFTVSPVNDNFTDTDEVLNVNEDSGTTTGNLLIGTVSVDGAVSIKDFSIAGESGTFTLGTAYVISGKGSITINTDGSYSFTPTANYNGSIPVIAYTVTDGSGTDDTSTLTITVAPVNDNFTDTDEVLNVNEDSGTTTGNLLIGTVSVDGAVSIKDFSIAGESGTFTLGTAYVISGKGSITINTDGSYSFTPAANYNGSIPVITYTVTDGSGTDDTSTLTITVAPVNDNFTDTDEVLNVNEDSGTTTGNLLIGTISVDGAVSIKDFSIAGESGTFTLGTAYVISGKGSITINTDGSYSFTPAANYNGSIPVITYTVTDGSGTDDTSTLTITVAPVNDNFTDTDEVLNVNEDSGTTTGNLLIGTISVDGAVSIKDFSIAGESGTFTLGTAYVISGKGSITINTDGSYSFTPAANYNGSIPVITYTVTDGSGTDDTSTLTITVAPVNDNFTDTDEVLNVNEDSGTTTGNLLIGTISVDGAVSIKDFSIAGESGTFTLGTAYVISGKGSITINTDGSYSFTPTANYNGSIPVITYTVTDGSGTDDTSTLTITVAPVNDNFTDTDEILNVNEDSGTTTGNLLIGTVSVDGAVSIKDFSIAGESGTFTLGTAYVISGKGSITINTDGSYSFTPAANYNGSIPVITYTVTDGSGTDDTSTLTITVAPVNDNPEGADVTITTQEDTAYNGTVTATDKDGDTLTFTKNTDPSHGTVVVNTDGSYIYTPDTDYNGGDSFTVTVSDGHGGTDIITVTITVTPANDNPEGTDVAITTQEDTAYNGTVTATDKDGDTLTFTKNTDPSHGTVVVNTDGSYIYTPDTDYNGGDSFTVTVSDGHGGTDIITVTVTVTPVNDNPEGTDVAITTQEDTAYNGTVTATDKDGDTLTFTKNTDPSHGTVVVNADGSYIYTPDTDYNGSDSFTVTVSDGHGGTDIITVTVTVTPVNDNPEGTDVAITTQEDTAYNGTVTATDKDGDTLTYTKNTDPSHGTVVVNTDGSYIYTPDTDYNGGDSFTVTVSDGHGGTDIITVTITVTPVNDNPEGTDVTITTQEDTAYNGTVTATDKDGDTLTFTKNTDPSHGTVVVNTDGSYIYTPDTDYNGGDSFTVTVSDGHGGTDIITVTITVTPVNDNPEGTDVTITTQEDTAYNGTVTATDKDGDTLTFTKNTDPSHGTVVVNTDGSYIYTPDTDYNGGDSFTVTVSDGHGGTDIITVTITVTPANDNPEGTDVAITTQEDTAYNGTVTATDKDGDTLTFTKNTDPSHGTVVVNTDGSYIYTPDTDYNGGDSFTVTVSDGHGGTTTITVTVTVTGTPELYKSATKPVRVGKNIYSWTYTITIDNDTHYAIGTIELTDNLDDVFSGTGCVYEVTGVNATGSLIANTKFNGSADINLLQSGQTIPANTKDSVLINIKVTTINQSDSLKVYNQAEMLCDLNGAKIKASSDAISSTSPMDPTETTIPYIYIVAPDAFTPNGDTFNDTYVIDHSDNLKVEIQVFNRWGNLVYINKNYQNNWDGKGTSGFYGKELPEGTYFCMIKAVDVSTGEIIENSVKTITLRRD